jgi:hypothetical protein
LVGFMAVLRAHRQSEPHRHRSCYWRRGSRAGGTELRRGIPSRSSQCDWASFGSRCCRVKGGAQCSEWACGLYPSEPRRPFEWAPGMTARLWGRRLLEIVNSGLASVGSSLRALSDLTVFGPLRGSVAQISAERLSSSAAVNGSRERFCRFSNRSVPGSRLNGSSQRKSFGFSLRPIRRARR